MRSETAGGAQRVVSKEYAAVLYRNKTLQNWLSYVLSVEHLDWLCTLELLDRQRNTRIIAVVIKQIEDNLKVNMRKPTSIFV